MILADSKIKEYQEKGILHIEDFNEKQLNPNSYNLRLMNKLLVYEKGVIIDAKKENKTREIIIPEEGYVLQPGELYIGSTVEYTETHAPLVSKVEGRSSIGRLGILVHYTAAWIDSGFCGRITLEIGCVRPVRIYPNMEICQIVYELVEGEIEKPYCGKYQGQSEPVASRMHIDLNKIFYNFDPYIESYYYNNPKERPKEDRLEYDDRRLVETFGVEKGNIFKESNSHEIQRSVLKNTVNQFNNNLASGKDIKLLIRSKLESAIRRMAEGKAISNKDNIIDYRVDMIIKSIDERYNDVIDIVGEKGLNLEVIDIHDSYYNEISKLISKVNTQSKKYVYFRNKILRDMNEDIFILQIVISLVNGLIVKGDEI